MDTLDLEVRYMRRAFGPLWSLLLKRAGLSDIGRRKDMTRLPHDPPQREAGHEQPPQPELLRRAGRRLRERLRAALTGTGVLTEKRFPVTRTPSRPIPEPPSGGPVAAGLKSNFLSIGRGYRTASGEIVPLVPVPEPSTWFGGGGLLGLVLWHGWRRRKRS